RAGRTNSPARTGSIRIAANPTNDVNRSFLTGTTWMGSSRNFHRHARSVFTSVQTTMYAKRVHQWNWVSACFAGRNGNAPARRSHTNTSATTKDSTTLMRCCFIQFTIVPVTVERCLVGSAEAQCEKECRLHHCRTHG